jgi:hypothetical protein
VVAAVVITRVGPSAPSHAQPPVSLPSTELPATELPPVNLTAMRVLDRLSVAAGRAPQPTGQYAGFTEFEKGLGVTYKRTTIFDGLTGDVWTYQHGRGVPSNLPVSKHISPTRAEFAAWPTNPAKLRTLLLTPGVPADALGESFKAVAKGETPDGLVFQEATNWLWDPLLSPALRSAMYKVLAATPGVVVKTGTKDMTGRPAIEISRRDSVTGELSTTFESPSTGAVLEQDFSDAGTDVFGPVTGYATVPPDPYSGG